MSNYPALDSLEADLASPASAPRSLHELSRRVEDAGAAGALDPGLVYVPDPDGPATPDSRDEQALGPVPRLEPEVRALSARSKAAAAALLSLVNETSRAQAGVAALLAQAAARMSALRARLASPTGSWMSVTDRFLDLSNVDGSQSRGVLVDTRGHGGVTLDPVSELDLSPNASVRVTGPPPGIPGDNTEVVGMQDLATAQSPAQGSASDLSAARGAASSGGTGQEPTVTFATGSDGHNALAAVFSDQDGQYFDWERVYVPPTQKCTLHGTAYVYDDRAGSLVDVAAVTEGYGWTASFVMDDGNVIDNAPLAYLRAPSDPLRLSVRLDLGSAQPMNQFELSVRQVGGLWPSVDSVTVSADGSEWFALRCDSGSTSWSGDSPSLAASPPTAGVDGTVARSATGDGAIGVSVWTVPTLGAASPNSGDGGFPRLRYVNVSLSQAQAYSCPKGVGHPYYVEVTEEKKSSSSWFGLSHSKSDTTTVTRLPGPQQIVNVTPGIVSQSSSSGSKLLSGAGQILDSPGLKTNPTLTLVGAGLQVLGSLWGKSSDTKSVLQAGEYVDVFRGSRQCISLRRMRPLLRQFDTSAPGQLIGANHTFPQSFTAVRLLTDDAAPAGTSVAYDVSFDDGVTWQAITPLDLGIPPPVSPLPLSVLTLDSPASTARVRATLTTTDPSKTPRWLGYSLEALPALT